MNTKSRIASILHTHCLDDSVTGLPTFDISALEIDAQDEYLLPTNVRLGHLAEKVISETIKSSSNFEVLHENIQIIDDGRTIGELDFIIKNKNTQLIHLEMAYKFYLYDPSISSVPINNWIGPNRNDSLNEKIDKLLSKQFPLLYHPITKSTIPDIDIDNVSQALCFLVSLYIPYKHKAKLSPVFQEALKGYYMDFDAFASLDHSSTMYYIPTKKEWGMDPSENQSWILFKDIVTDISNSINNQQALMCWQKNNQSHEAFFIVWW